jgi:hypothetical protein
MSSPSENAAERAAEDLPGNTAGRTAAERFCHIAGDLGADAARDAAGDDLARCKAPAARVVGAEDAANEGAEAAENAAAGAGWRRSLPAFGLRQRSQKGSGFPNRRAKFPFPVHREFCCKALKGCQKRRRNPRGALCFRKIPN